MIASLAGLLLGDGKPGFSQGLYAPAPGPDLERLSRRMSEAIRDLGEDITARAGQVPAGQNLARDAQELERATGEWYASLRGGTDPYQVRRSYSGIDAAWHRLRAQLASPGSAIPETADEIARVEKIDVQIHEALQLNGYPPNVDAAPSTGPDETRRLAYSLAQRGEALAATIRVDYGADPNAAGLINASAELARMVDAFYDGMSNPSVALRPEDARQQFSQINQKSNSLGVALGATAIPPRVKAAGDAYGAALNLILSNLGMTAPTPNGLPAPIGVGGGIPYQGAVGNVAPAPPTGQDELRRLALVLAQRVEVLTATMQADFGPDPNAAGLVNASAELARMVVAFADLMSNPGIAQRPDEARLQYSQILQKSVELGLSMASFAIPPRVKMAWDPYTVDLQPLRLPLGLTAQTSNGLPAPNIAGPANPFVANQPAPVAQWADELDRQVDELLANFAPTAPAVPEGRQMLDEMVRLRDDVRNFRDEASQGLDTGRLAYRFREVDADCHRLSRHFARIGRGRSGPNIQRVQQISQTCEQIHRALGMPGYPPTFGPYDGDR
jgi:hypothetical protein